MSRCGSPRPQPAERGAARERTMRSSMQPAREPLAIVKLVKSLHSHPFTPHPSHKSTRIMLPRRIVQLFLVATAVAVGQGSHVAAQSDSPPNVVFIVADDLGYRELGCFGQKRIRTPHLDRLAEQGMRLTQHYSGNDVGETSNVADEHPDVVGELTSMMESVRTPSQDFPLYPLDAKQPSLSEANVALS